MKSCTLFGRKWNSLNCVYTTVRVHNTKFPVFFSLHLQVPIYWSNRAENAPTAVALYCELVYTFHSLWGQTRASLYFCNCRSPRERRSNVKPSNYKLKMTGCTFSLGSHLRLGIEVRRKRWRLGAVWLWPVWERAGGKQKHGHCHSWSHYFTEIHQEKNTLLKSSRLLQILTNITSFHLISVQTCATILYL